MPMFCEVVDLPQSCVVGEKNATLFLARARLGERHKLYSKMELL